MRYGESLTLKAFVADDILPSVKSATPPAEPIALGLLGDTIGLALFGDIMGLVLFGDIIVLFGGE